MRTTIAALFAALTAVTAPMISTPAHAQGLPLLGGPNAISIGIFAPSSGDARSSGSSNQYYIDATYGIPVSVPLTPTRTVLDISGEFGTNDGNHSNIIPLTVGEDIGADGRSPFSANNVFYGAGVGFYLENIGSFSSTGRLGGYGTVGYNIGLGFFLQAKYQIVQEANGPIFTAGYRF